MLALPAPLPTTAPVRSHQIRDNNTYFIDVLHQQYRAMCTNATPVPHLATSPHSPPTAQSARSQTLQVSLLFPLPMSSLTVLSLQEAGNGMASFRA